MKRFVAVAALAVVLWTTRAAVADLAPRPVPRPPVPAPDTAVPFHIDMDEKAQVSRLQIPANMLRLGRADAGFLGEDAFAEAESPWRRTVAGVALSLSVGAGGFWLVRRRRLGKGLATALVLLGLAGAGAMVWANAVPVPPRPVPPAAGAQGKVVLEIVNPGTTVRLILAPNALLKDGRAGVGEVPVPRPPAPPPPPPVPAPPPGNVPMLGR
jgi:hypothetical protein